MAKGPRVLNPTNDYMEQQLEAGRRRLAKRDRTFEAPEERRSVRLARQEQAAEARRINPWRTR